MVLKDFCRKIHLQDEITGLVLDYEKQFPSTVLQKSMDKLFHRTTWDEVREEIKRAIGDDAKGVKILTCMLLCAKKTYEKYAELGMEEQVLTDTMKCFSRFIGEHKESYGTYAFDRDWWTVRQVSGSLFRIGELEYEMVDEKAQKVVSIHIPSDAVLTKENFKASYEKAKEILQQFFPAYSSADMICCSWLLSPALQKLLPKHSHILEFQKAFVIEQVDLEDMAFLQWVYKNPNYSLEELPEETSLQRNMKQYLLQGGKVGEALGRLTEPIVCMKSSQKGFYMGEGKHRRYENV